MADRKLLKNRVEIWENTIWGFIVISLLYIEPIFSPVMCRFTYGNYFYYIMSYYLFSFNLSILLGMLIVVCNFFNIHQGIKSFISINIELLIFMLFVLQLVTLFIQLNLFQLCPSGGLCDPCIPPWLPCTPS